MFLVSTDKSRKVILMQNFKLNSNDKVNWGKEITQQKY